MINLDPKVNFENRKKQYLLVIWKEYFEFTHSFEVVLVKLVKFSFLLLIFVAIFAATESFIDFAGDWLLLLDNSDSDWSKLRENNLKK